MKPVVWLGSSKSDLKAFPSRAMYDMGHQLFRVQCGLDPDDWKPMASIGSGAVYVLHCFRKKTPKTALQDIELARERLAEVPRRATHG